MFFKRNSDGQPVDAVRNAAGEYTVSDITQSEFDDFVARVKNQLWGYKKEQCGPNWGQGKQYRKAKVKARGRFRRFMFGKTEKTNVARDIR